MSSIYPRGGRLWMRIKEGGKWHGRPTKYRVGSERDAERYAVRAQERIDRRSAEAPVPGGPLTVAQYAIGTWIEKRKELDLDWRNDLGRLKHHVLPTLGKLLLSEVSAPHIVALMHKLRTSPTKATKAPLAQRSIYNIYSVISAMFRDAELAGLIDRAPAKLTAYQLGPLVDSDPEWRDGSVFTREEAEVLISHPGIPLDRRMVYALGVLAGLRPGEAAALRWRHYDATTAPLGRLTVALAYNTRKHRAKTTKTDAVRHVPVHPTLAAMLAEWRLVGWAAMMGRRPESDDLIVPLPPDAIARRRRRTGDAFRGHDYSGKKWREHDMPLLGWRYREPYATKSTFITLVIEDGAKPDVIRDRVTHTKAARDAFSGYDRGPHWIEACGEVSKLQLTRRLATSFATAGQLLELSAEKSGGGGSRTRVRRWIRTSFYACRHAI
jgi:integrase